jgi:tetratricopeptide (TPR) repeat protein
MAIGRGYGPNMPRVLRCLAQVASDEHRYGQAIPLFRQALSLQQGSDTGTPCHASILVGLGQAYLAIGHETEALPLLTRAVEVYGSGEHDAGELGDAYFALARALLTNGAPREHALLMASRARAHYAAAEEPKRAELSRVAAWVAANGGE